MLDVLSKYCGKPDFVKSKSLTGGFLEKFFVGTTHDLNSTKMILSHETEPQNFLNLADYMTTNGIKETTSFEDTYPENKVIEGKYLNPYLYQYKRIILD